MLIDRFGYHDEMDAARPSQLSVQLPGGDGALRAVLAEPGQTATAVEPLLKLDAPIGPLQSYVVGLFAADEAMLEAIEMVVAPDPQNVAPAAQISHEPLLAALKSGAAAPPHRAVCAPPAAPIVFCRKMRVSFAAPVGGDSAMPATFAPLIDEIGRSAAALAAQAATGPTTEIVTQCAALPCAVCVERRRCFPADDGYSFAADRLSLVHSTTAKPRIEPLGEFRLSEAAAIIGGAPATGAIGDAARDDAFARFRRTQAAALDRSVRRAVDAESDGREALEILRLKLRLTLDAFEQLAATWTSGAHLCWNDDTIRVAWRTPGGAPAHWGFSAILRKRGVQPQVEIDPIRETRVTCPPIFSAKSLLPPRAADASRYFGEPRKASLFVKDAKRDTVGTVETLVLAEEAGIPLHLFEPADSLTVVGENLNLILSPTGSHAESDGEAVELRGIVQRQTPLTVKGASIPVTLTWYPRFGQAVDLYAFALLTLEALIGTDERRNAAFQQSVAESLESLHQLCATLPIEQRDIAARRWVMDQALIDTPAALWTRRNLRFPREERGSSLDALPVGLWQAILIPFVRALTQIDGFSYCARRSLDVPQVEGTPLPLLELRGLVELVDDELFGRTAAKAAIARTLSAET